LEVKFKRKIINIETRKVSGLERIFGLMFKKSNTDNLLFIFDKNVRYSYHSLFVFFPFIILFLDEKNKVIECKKVNPFCFKINCGLEFRKVIEIPINYKNRKFIEFFRRGRKI
jgi:uncharacterized membrane protein (UPF0127 family)